MRDRKDPLIHLGCSWSLQDESSIVVGLDAKAVLVLRRVVLAREDVGDLDDRRGLAGVLIMIVGEITITVKEEPVLFPSSDACTLVEIT